MRLELLEPPVLVAVADSGVLLPALLLAVRGERRYVQVSRGFGLNHLRWVDAAAVYEAGAVPAVRGPAPGAGLPWVRARSSR